MVLAHFLRKTPLGDQSTVSWSVVRTTVQVTPLTWRQITASLVENGLQGVGKTHFLWAPSAQLLAGEAFRDQESPCTCDFQLSGWKLFFQFFPLSVFFLSVFFTLRWGRGEGNRDVIFCWLNCLFICLSLPDLLHSIWQSLGLSMLLQMPLFHSFYGRVIFHCM